MVLLVATPHSSERAQCSRGTYIPLKRQALTKLHGITMHKTTLFIVTFVRTSHRTICIQFIQRNNNRKIISFSRQYSWVLLFWRDHKQQRHQPVAWEVVTLGPIILFWYNSVMTFYTDILDTVHYCSFFKSLVFLFSGDRVKQGILIHTEFWKS
jgi:hypothetical protein